MDPEDSASPSFLWIGEGALCEENYYVLSGRKRPNAVMMCAGTGMGKAREPSICHLYSRSPTTILSGHTRL